MPSSHGEYLLNSVFSEVLVPCYEVIQLDGEGGDRHPYDENSWKAFDSRVTKQR